MNNIAVRDRRTERVQADHIENLTLRVTDDLGQIAERQLPVNVVVDKIPDASKLTLNYPKNSFYGERIGLDIDGFSNANDGAEPVVVSLLETNPIAGKEVFKNKLTQPNHLKMGSLYQRVKSLIIAINSMCV